MGRPGPAWGHWGYTEDFLPAAFHNLKGPGSFPSVLTWVKGKPLAIFEGQAPGYCRIEKTLLVLGLAMRELHRVLFTDEDDSLDFPDYVKNSPFTISDWTKAIEGCEALLSDVPIPLESTNGADPNTGHSETRYVLWSITQNVLIKLETVVLNLPRVVYKRSISPWALMEARGRKRVPGEQLFSMMLSPSLLTRR